MFNKKDKFVPTPEQQKLLQDYNSYLKSCEHSANEPDGCDCEHEWAVQNLQRVEKALLATRFPREELPDEKQRIKEERLNKAIGKVEDVITAPVMFVLFDVPNKIKERFTKQRGR